MQLGGYDKRTWGPGPWQWEPDEFYAEFYGFHCYASRHLRQGNWCGYIELPSEHPWYGDYYGEHYDIEVHGGLTFGDWASHISDGFLFGFDCGHVGDFKPASDALWSSGVSSGRHNPEMFTPVPDGYRTLPYVLGELKGLARQARAAWET